MGAALIHIANLMAKTGTINRVQLAVLGMRGR